MVCPNTYLVTQQKYCQILWPPEFLPTTEQLYHFAKTHSGPNISCPMKNSWVQWKKGPVVGCWVYAGDEKLSTYLGFFGTWNSKQTNPQTTPSRWFQPKNMSQIFIISPKIGKKFEIPPPQTLTHPVSPHVLFPQTCLTTAPKMARFQLALRHRGLFFHVAPLHYLSPNEKRAPWLFWGCKGMKHYSIPIYFVQLGIYGVI